MSEGPIVYLKGGKPRWIQTFHRTEQCRQLTKKPPRGEYREIISRPLRELTKVVPCRTCYPDAPSREMSRRYCPKCNHTRARPCAHNGGVLVTINSTWNVQRLRIDPGDPYTRQIYVWPNRAHFYK